MAKTKLDPEEQELLNAYESGEFESDLDADRREYLTKAAEETFKAPILIKTVKNAKAKQ